MTSDRQRSANRANGRLSAGPKTDLGKIRSSRNAFRHGLAVASARPFGDDVDHLAAELAEIGSYQKISLSQEAAEFTKLIFNVRDEKCAVIDAFLLDSFVLQDSYENNDNKLSAKILGEVISQLTKLDRYERRALSRRKKALRSLLGDQLQS